MSADKDIPDLDSFIGRRTPGPCAYVRSVPADLRGKITAKVSDGIRSWSSFERWLAACGHSVGTGTIGYHYNRGHADDA